VGRPRHPPLGRDRHGNRPRRAAAHHRMHIKSCQRLQSRSRWRLQQEHLRERGPPGARPVERAHPRARRGRPAEGDPAASGGVDPWLGCKAISVLPFMRTHRRKPVCGDGLPVPVPVEIDHAGGYTMTVEIWEYPKRCISCEAWELWGEIAEVTPPDLLCENCRNLPRAHQLEKFWRRNHNAGSVRAVSGGLPSLGKRR
jgi:hypothetical protein